MDGASRQRVLGVLVPPVLPGVGRENTVSIALYIAQESTERRVSLEGGFSHYPTWTVPKATALPCGGREPLHPSHQTDIKRNTTACEDLPVKPLPGLQMPECLGDYKDSASQTFMVLTSETSGEGGGSMETQGRPAPSALWSSLL